MTVTAAASIDRSLVLAVGDATISGSNPVVEGLIGPFRSKVAAEANRTIDLAAQLPAGVTVSDVSDRGGRRRRDLGDVSASRVTESRGPATREPRLG